MAPPPQQHLYQQELSAQMLTSLLVLPEQACAAAAVTWRECVMQATKAPSHLSGRGGPIRLLVPLYRSARVRHFYS